MALVRRPSKVICTFRGNLLVLQNEESTADMDKFEADVKELEALLESAIGLVWERN